jgi:hypothetical protein
VHKTFAILTLSLFGTAASGWAQTPAPAPSAQQLNIQLLAEALRTAATFHDLVKNLNTNVEKNLAVNGASSSPSSAQSLSRTAEIVGAGAGAGAAMGELSGSQKGMMIGAAAGAAGALVIDQIVRHHEAAKAAAQAEIEAQPIPEPREFKVHPAPPLQQ